MKLFWIVCFLMFAHLVSVHANRNSNDNYERTLHSFVVDEVSNGKEVSFILDNGWEFIGEIPFLEESKLYSLSKLAGQHVRISCNPQSDSLVLTFENNKRGFDKISFHVAIAKSTYDTLLTVADVQMQNYIFYHTANVTLSDGSIWYVEGNKLDIEMASTYWSQGDRVLITKRFDANNRYTMVNLDVSGCLYVDYYKTKDEHWYSMRDPRCLDASSIEKK